jgi:hypothetical protein
MNKLVIMKDQQAVTTSLPVADRLTTLGAYK